MSEQTPTIGVDYLAGDRLSVSVRGHQLAADQPVGEGGEDTGPTPTEFFLAGLAGRVAFYAERFLRRHGRPTGGLAVSCDWAWEHDPVRVGEIQVRVEAPGLTIERHEAFVRVIERCPIHNTLQPPSDVRFRVTGPVEAHELMGGAGSSVEGSQP